MKKKMITVLCAALLALTLAACSEAGPSRRSATAVAAGFDGNVTEVFIVIDGYDGVTHITFDEIFNVTYGSQMTKAVYDGETIPAEFKFEVAGARSSTYHYQYISVADKLFAGRAEGTTAVYDEISTAADKITDLNAYMGKKENVQWYYDAYKAAKLKVLTPNANGTITVEGETQKFNASNMTTTYGSMRKSRSSYWASANASQASGLAWKGNMDALANFVYANGFDGLDYLDGFDDSEKAPEIQQKIKLVDGYVNITNDLGLIPSGATLSSDTYLYLGAAYRAYTAARGY